MKSVILLLLFSTFCFCQNEVFTIAQIDSIAKANGNWSIVEGKTDAKKGNIEGNGGFSFRTFLNYYNQEYYNSLSKDEKKKYNREKDSELVKADYNQVIWYDDHSGEKVFGQFYYFYDKLVYAKIKYTLIDKTGKEESQDFNLGTNDFRDPRPIKNVLLFDVKYWVENKNKEILKHYKNK